MVGQGSAQDTLRLRTAPLIAPAFTHFVGIDWSGAVGTAHPSIAVASALAGDAAPAIVAPPGRVWSREAVLASLRTLAAARTRALIGMDFSFAPPFTARGAYLPGTLAPTNARAFWAYVDSACDDADLGAASFANASHRAHFYHGSASGPKSAFQHWRVCETAFKREGGGKASSIFDCVGAAQVAKASFAGMRLLYALGPAIPVWPFDRVPDTGPLLVEIYTRAFLRRAGGHGRKLRTRAALDTALAALGSRAWEGDEPLTDHLTDALVTAAGLRHAASEVTLWHPPALTPEIAKTEGWTFGVA